MQATRTPFAFTEKVCAKARQLQGAQRGASRLAARCAGRAFLRHHGGAVPGLTFEGSGAVAAFALLATRGQTTSDILDAEIDSKVVGYMRFARVVVGGIRSAQHSAPQLSSPLAGSPLMPLRRAPHRPDPAGVVGVRCAEARLNFLMLEPYLSTSISVWQRVPTGSCNFMLLAFRLPAWTPTLSITPSAQSLSLWRQDLPYWLRLFSIDSNTSNSS